jgi:YD repeat-containing protein
MNKTLRRAGGLACALLASTASTALACAFLSWSSAAVAQGIPEGLVPPRRFVNSRGLDLVNGEMHINIPLVSFGEHAPALRAFFEVGSPYGGEAGLVNDFSRVGATLAVRPQAYISGAAGDPNDFGPYENIVFPSGAGFTQTFYPWGNHDGSSSIHVNPDGSRYTHSFGTSHFTRFESTDPNLTGAYDAEGTKGVIDPSAPFLDLFQKIIFANGEEWRYYRQYVTIPCNLNCQTPQVTINRLRFLTSSRGYGIQFLYQSDTTPSNSSVAGAWRSPRRVTAYNKVVSYCDESLLQECTSLSALPSAQITYDSTAKTVLVREPGATHGTELSYATMTNICCVLTSMRYTAVPNSTVSFQIGSDNAGGAYLSSVTDSDGTWTYSRIVYVDDSGRQPLMMSESIDPAGSATGVFGYGVFGSIQWFRDELGRTHHYSDGFPFRDWGSTDPGGIDTAVNRDARNNIISIDRTPASWSSLPMMRLYSASYPVDCMNPRTCNRPTSTTDGNNNTTVYTYAPEHGGVLIETGPAVNGVQPQTRHEYAQRYAWISNGAGGYVQAATPIWVRTATSLCRTSAADPTGVNAPCSVAGDEVRTEYDYGPNSGPNNLLLRGQTVIATDGGGTTTLRTCYGYDAMGNRVSETRPNGTASLSSCP